MMGITKPLTDVWIDPVTASVKDVIKAMQDAGTSPELVEAYREEVMFATYEQLLVANMKYCYDIASL